jgi:hypothetical protein
MITAYECMGGDHSVTAMDFLAIPQQFLHRGFVYFSCTYSTTAVGMWMITPYAERQLR